MTSPIDLLKNRLEEVSISLKSALNNNASSHDIKKITNIYNQYYVSLQLLDSHSEIDHNFSRLFVTHKGTIDYRMVNMKKHIKSINEKKINKSA
tara:strand:+ start:179 stop:460 length:282 start_codon:yes stop_codon:yes gene_type:complete